MLHASVVRFARAPPGVQRVQAGGLVPVPTGTTRVRPFNMVELIDGNLWER
jgi:hypothetical protein